MKESQKSESAVKRGKSNRRKGSTYELKVGKVLRDWSIPAAGPNDTISSWFVRTPRSGAWQRTITKSEDLLCPDWFPFIIECKSRGTAWRWHRILNDGEPLLEWLFETERKHKGKAVLVIFSQPHVGDWVFTRSKNIDEYMKQYTFPITTMKIGNDIYTIIRLTPLLEEMCPIKMRASHEKQNT